MQPMIQVPVLDPRTGKPKMNKKNHRTFGVTVGYAEYRRIPKGSDPEAEAWLPRLEECAREFLKTH